MSEDEWLVVEKASNAKDENPDKNVIVLLEEDAAIEKEKEDSSIRSSASAKMSAKHEILPCLLEHLRHAFNADSSGRVAQNCLANQSVYAVTLSREIVQQSLNPAFSVNLDMRTMPATNQMDSGRCWMFGTLNLFRFGARDVMKKANFEFSESFLYFYYLLEQSNFFLQFIIDTADRPLDDRLLSMMLELPIDDGGDWGIAINLIQKYGLVPKVAYPETFSSSDTDGVCTVLIDLLKSAACRLRCETDATKRSSIKWQVIAKAYRILCVHLGTPPERFDWQWRDVEDEFQRRESLTPKDFCQTYVKLPIHTYVSVIHDPRHEYYKNYTVDYTMPICGAKSAVFLNVPIDEIKDMSRRMLQDGHPVWFACTVEDEMDDDLGLWDQNLYNLSDFYQTSLPRLSKVDRILYGDGMGDHVMLITGVDAKDDVTHRWRVENSWGQDSGDSGYYTMNDNWFDEYVFEVVSPPEYLSAAARKGLATEPRVLPPWDPMQSTRRRLSRRCTRRR